MQTQKEGKITDLLAQDWVHWRDCVNMVINFQLKEKKDKENFLVRQITV